MSLPGALLLLGYVLLHAYFFCRKAPVGVFVFGLIVLIILALLLLLS